MSLSRFTSITVCAVFAITCALLSTAYAQTEAQKTIKYYEDKLDDLDARTNGAKQTTDPQNNEEALKNYGDRLDEFRAGRLGSDQSKKVDGRTRFTNFLELHEDEDHGSVLEHATGANQGSMLEKNLDGPEMNGYTIEDAAGEKRSFQGKSAYHYKIMHGTWKEFEQKKDSDGKTIPRGEADPQMIAIKNGDYFWLRKNGEPKPHIQKSMKPEIADKVKETGEKLAKQVMQDAKDCKYRNLSGAELQKCLDDPGKMPNTDFIKEEANWAIEYLKNKNKNRFMKIEVDRLNEGADQENRISRSLSGAATPAASGGAGSTPVAGPDYATNLDVNADPNNNEANGALFKYETQELLPDFQQAAKSELTGNDAASRAASIKQFGLIGTFLSKFNPALASPGVVQPGKEYDYYKELAEKQIKAECAKEQAKKDQDASKTLSAHCDSSKADYVKNKDDKLKEVTEDLIDDFWKSVTKNKLFAALKAKAEEKLKKDPNWDKKPDGSPLSRKEKNAKIYGAMYSMLQNFDTQLGAASMRNDIDKARGLDVVDLSNPDLYSEDRRCENPSAICVYDPKKQKLVFFSDYYKGVSDWGVVVTDLEEINARAKNEVLEDPNSLKGDGILSGDKMPGEREERAREYQKVVQWATQFKNVLDAQRLQIEEMALKSGDGRPLPPVPSVEDLIRNVASSGAYVPQYADDPRWGAQVGLKKGMPNAPKNENLPRVWSNVGKDGKKIDENLPVMAGGSTQVGTIDIPTAPTVRPVRPSLPVPNDAPYTTPSSSGDGTSIKGSTNY